MNRIVLVVSDQVSQLAPLFLPFFPVSLVLGRPLVLHPHPQLVHLREVLQDELHGIVDGAALPAQ